MSAAEQQFIDFAVAQGVLRFGEFITKAGRASPYFFNAGLFTSGASLGRLAGFYADALLAAEQRGVIGFDMLFGPAYKGISLAASTAIALAQRGRDISFAFNRKEVKDHGEGGSLIGAPLTGRVVIIDDVISAGTSVRQSVEIIEAAGAQPAGVLLALDRMERGGSAEQISAQSAVQEVRERYGMPVVAIATLDDLLDYLNASGDPQLATHRARVAAYRQRYGATAAVSQAQR